jgi:chromate transport protein ChrA
MAGTGVDELITHVFIALWRSSSCFRTAVGMAFTALLLAVLWQTDRPVAVGILAAMGIGIYLGVRKGVAETRRRRLTRVTAGTGEPNGTEASSFSAADLARAKREYGERYR